LEGWEGFMAVRYGPKEWALYFDRDGNGLKGIINSEMRIMEIVLVRREKKQENPDDDK